MPGDAACPPRPRRRSAPTPRPACARTSPCSRRACAGPSRPAPGKSAGSRGMTAFERLRPAGRHADHDDVPSRPRLGRRRVVRRRGRRRGTRPGHGRAPPPSPWRRARRRSRAAGRWRARSASARSPPRRHRAPQHLLAPTSLAMLTRTIGTGWRAICCRTNSTPSIPGMLKSQVTTSGFSSATRSSASCAVVGRPDHLEERAAREHLLDDLAHVRRVVHDQHAYDAAHRGSSVARGALTYTKAPPISCSSNAGRAQERLGRPDAQIGRPRHPVGENVHHPPDRRPARSR